MSYASILSGELLHVEQHDNLADNVLDMLAS